MALLIIEIIAISAIFFALSFDCAVESMRCFAQFYYNFETNTQIPAEEVSVEAYIIINSSILFSDFDHFGNTMYTIMFLITHKWKTFYELHTKNSMVFLKEKSSAFAIQHMDI